MTLWPTSPLALFTWAGLFVVLGLFFSTLRAAFWVSGRAGAARLAERFPRVRKVILIWSPRWDYIVAAMQLLGTAMMVPALFLVCMGILELDGIHQGTGVILACLVMIVIVSFAQNIFPRTLSEGYSDRISIMFFPMARNLTRLLWFLVWPAIRVERALAQMFLSGSDEEDRPSPEDAIRTLVSHPGNTDLEEEEKEIIRSVFEFGETVTREIMIPRVDMEGFEDESTISDCARKACSLRHSRFPVYHESMDNILGVFHVKDLLRALTENQGEHRIQTLAKAAPFVPESMPINDLLQLLRAEQSQLAIVVDEYGGTAGLVTVEDIIEELVGEIHDEYDVEQDGVRRLSDGSAILSARLPVYEANDMMSIHVPTSEEYDSLGGYVFHELGRIPKPGETIEGSGYRITIQTADARRILSVRIQKTPYSSTENL